MAQAKPQQTTTRLIHPDPTTNAIIQDLYNKLAQVQKELADLKALIPPP